MWVIPPRAPLLLGPAYAAARLFDAVGWVWRGLRSLWNFGGRLCVQCA